ncbi:MAG: DUF4277 domain-containing protein [Alicyclobacillus sp.]|nr:DUF4277 domain-containing protein [Alicyclobacillus sp.]
MLEPVSQFVVEAAPVFAELIRRWGWVERIDRKVPVGPEDCRLSVGLRVKALLINILTDRRALYHVEREGIKPSVWYANKPMAGLLPFFLPDFAH